MKTGVYVGSFNPVHKGHIMIINRLLDKYLDKVVVMPTGSYWEKNDLLPVEHRINMLKFYQTDRILIEDENNDLPYTYLVMEYLEKKYKNDEFYLIIGADNIVNFDRWQRFRDLLKYNLVIIDRDEIDTEFYLNRLDKKDKYLLIKDLGNIDISSTAIRGFIKANDLKSAADLVDKEVFDYITGNNLYNS